MHKSFRTSAEKTCAASTRPFSVLGPLVLRSRQVYINRLWKHCSFCRDCLEKETYILVVLALLGACNKVGVCNDHFSSHSPSSRFISRFSNAATNSEGLSYRDSINSLAVCPFVVFALMSSCFRLALPSNLIVSKSPLRAAKCRTVSSLNELIR